MSTVVFHRPTGALRFGGSRWLVVALVLALVFAPWLGQVHRALHGNHAHAATPHAVADPAHAAHHGIAALFGDHGQASECRLYDQLGHADLLICPPVAALPVVPPLWLVARLEGEAVARFAALFDARGPPSFR